MSLVITKPTLDFLEELKKNNNKAWMDENRNRYKIARKEFYDWVNSLIMKINTFYPIGPVEAKDCAFRINRDIRFSRDKTPYKPHFSAAFSPTGKKVSSGTFYIRIGGENFGFIGAGCYEPNSQLLQKIRTSISTKPELFLTTIKKIKEPLEGRRIKTTPRGFKKEDPMIDYLRMKGFFVGHHLTSEEILNPKFFQKTIQYFQKRAEFIHFFNQFI